MITDINIWNEENDYLECILNEINRQIDHGTNNSANYKKEVIQTQKEMWDDVKCAPTDLKDLDVAAQSWHYQVEISNQVRKYKFTNEIVKRLETMKLSPYFGRIDFIEDGEKEEKIYIGINNLRTDKSRKILIYDWRAPISSLFYDYEVGKSSYECPAGKIEGYMSLKRQYRIENEKIKFMFESSLRINDEMLQEVLGKNTDNRMKSIVTSIQQDQNRVIRNDENKILIVQGAAGSGKTSIALHRAAYILYKHKDTIKSENILVFSPNQVFDDYISSVLPTLGEEDIQRSTFLNFFKIKIEQKYKIETMNEHMEYILSGYCEEIRLKGIKFKASITFLNIIKNYIKYIESAQSWVFEDINFKENLIISGIEIKNLFVNDYKQIPFLKRLEKLRNRLLYLIESYEEERIMELEKDNSFLGNHINNNQIKKKLKQDIKNEVEKLKENVVKFTEINLMSLYVDLFKKIDLFSNDLEIKNFGSLKNISEYTIDKINKNMLCYEDVAPIIFLKLSLDTLDENKSFKHIIIDEAQDYSAIQYEIFKKVFGNCKITILGDINQSINGYMNIGSFDMISNVFEGQNTASISLLKSYRSTKEIADFSSKILPSQLPVENLNRNGEKPRVIKVTRDRLSYELAEDIKGLQVKKYKLIAVICKTASQCEGLYNEISEYIDVTFISSKNELYEGGVVIIPSYLAKGLEFDAVIINSVESDLYSKEEDRRLIYTMCTRALHELHLYYHDCLSGFINEIEPGLFHFEV